MEQERIRLLLIDSTKKSRESTIINGVGNILGRWPSYIVSAIWCIICVVSLVSLIIVLTIVLTLNERFVRLEDIKGMHISQKLANEFCSRVTNKENHIVGRSVKSLKDPETLIQDTSENLFYSLVNPLSKKEACGVESVLRLCPDKLIYLIHFDSKSQNGPKRYESLLRMRYSNLNEILADGPNYVRASPFEGQWKKDNASMMVTNILTIWQFGGTSLSPNLIMRSREILDLEKNNCRIDREFIFCPEQCSPFVYQLMSTLIKNMNSNKGNSSEEIVDLSLADFCGSSQYSKIGCAGVKRIDESLLCTTKANHCMFIRIEEWSKNSERWKSDASEYCPVIMKLD